VFRVPWVSDPWRGHRVLGLHTSFPASEVPPAFMATLSVALESWNVDSLRRALRSVDDDCRVRIPCLAPGIESGRIGSNARRREHVLDAPGAVTRGSRVHFDVDRRSALRNKSTFQLSSATREGVAMNAGGTSDAGNMCGAQHAMPPPRIR